MRLLLFVLTLFISTLFTHATTPNKLDNKPVDHAQWNTLLKKYVSEKGFVDYTGFKKDAAELKKYLDLMSQNAPNDSWSKDDQLAYWINAYNAFTVQLILDNYGVKSIKDIGSKIKIPFVNTPWDVKFINIGGKKMDLNNIEHGVIRKKFAEPRIHFALVCAAKSCPKLRNEAFVGSKLNDQLDDQGRDFLNDNTKNVVSKDKASLSKILSWYGGDFTKTMPMTDWVNKYAKVKMDKDASISHLDYNWELNGK
ncbi:MAG: DUF547 domain-containing protein [Runella slithyformis]|nr:MAG: DUF547 domain-containing protein [Runella slithyformis]TAF00929.1 MAG: DUF547 domain-containing protein [Runella slithyformis]TAF48326.1 MAG: DUF547 domain-containing protein [Runella slithyformis]TAF83212.1 MAG: DUF547 domain-containing protein [Runella slithyformis]